MKGAGLFAKGSADRTGERISIPRLAGTSVEWDTPQAMRF